MIILPVLAVTIAIALVTGGSLGNLTALQLKWRGLILGGFAIQLFVFSPLWQDNRTLSPFTQAAYLASLFFLFVALAANYRIPGLVLIGPGFLMNLIAVAVNGGYMPASSSALQAAGLPPLGAGEILQNSIGIGPATNLVFLGDVFAIPKWFLFPNVFSVGDVLISIGAVYLVLKALAPRPQPQSDSTNPS
ncbi:MAG: DUF5317 domain-containing protein [Chloroflexi bacterium]|nr:DUF5317 domain-containing protein [Chloroflexota bacterium]